MVTVVADKLAELEERQTKMEERLKIVFGEIERRLDIVQQGPTHSQEERIQELEDLLLLLQLENTKLKEKVGEGLDFGIAPIVPDLQTRLTKVEEALAGKDVIEGSNIEERLAALEAGGVKTPGHDSDAEIHELRKRIKTLEALLETRGREEIEAADASGVLGDIQKILKDSA